MRVRVRKNTLILSLVGYERAGLLTSEHRQRFEAMYRSCRTLQEQNQVRMALHDFMMSLKEGNDHWALIMRDDDPLGLESG